MSVEQLYQLEDRKQIISVSGEGDAQLLRNVEKLDNWLQKVISSDRFQKEVFIHRVPLFNKEVVKRDPDMKKKRDMVIRIIVNCAVELMKKVILEICGKRFNPKFLRTIAIACASISIKLIGAFDWIWEESVVDELLKECNSVQFLGAGNCSKDRVLLLEKDILFRTNWKACESVMNLDVIYDELFEQKEDVSPIQDQEEMLQLSSRYRQSLPAFKTHIVILIYKDGNWYIKLVNDGTLISRYSSLINSIRKAKVMVYPSVIEMVIRERGLSNEDEAIDWIRNRVLFVGFDMTDVSLKIVDENLLASVPEYAFDPSLTHEVSLSMIKGNWYLKGENGILIDEQSAIINGLRKAVVNIRLDTLESVMETEGISMDRPSKEWMQEGIEWVKDNVLRDRFHLEKYDLYPHIPDDAWALLKERLFQDPYLGRRRRSHRRSKNRSHRRSKNRSHRHSKNRSHRRSKNRSRKYL